MNNIQVIPNVIQNILVAKIEMSDYDVSSPMLFEITARRSDGLRVTGSYLYPNEQSDPEVGLFVSMFPVNNLDSFQLVDVKIDEIRVNQYFTEIKDGISARYDDSYINLADVVDMTDVNLDFDVLLIHDPKKIVLSDSSSWGILGYEHSMMDVKIPGYDDVFTFFWDKGSVNTYTMPMFKTVEHEGCELKFEDFPDGIYEFTLRSNSGDSVFKRYLKMDSVRLELDRLMVKASVIPDDMDKELLSKVNDIYDLIAFAESNMRLGNLKNASYLLCMIEDKIDQAKNCKNC